jgi:hypothetical protein
VNGPGVRGAQRPGLARPELVMVRLERSAAAAIGAPLGGDSPCLFSLRTGELGRLPIGVLGNEPPAPVVGVRVKRNSFGETCQNDRRDTNMAVYPAAGSPASQPTEESSHAIKPILSNFGNRCFPRNTPSLLMLMRQSALGLASRGVFFDASVVT